MKFTLTLIIALALPAFAGAKVLAATGNPVPADSTQGQTPRLSARAYLLFDYTSRQILLEHNSHERIEPASLTKLMTAYITFSALKQNRFSLNQTVSPSSHSVRSQRSESRMYLGKDRKVTIAELLRGLIVVSANDAARTLAETIAGNEGAFSEIMNREAQRLGMSDSHFVNATGLPDPLHYSSARDLALLSAAILNDFPEHYPLYALREYEYNYIKHYNRNRLLWLDPHVDGMKTGHTDNSGYSLVATAKRNGHRLISVVLGTASENLRSTESQRLLNYGFQNFDIFYLYEKNQPVSNIRLWKGTENSVKVGIREGLAVTIPKGRRSLLKATIETRQPLLAPISDGQQIALLRLTFDDKPYLEFPLVALEPVPLVNIFSRGIDSIRMIFIR